MTDVWCMVYGVWCMVHGACCMVYGAWCMVYGVWCMVYDAWFMSYDMRCLVCAALLRMYVLWYMLCVLCMVCVVWYRVCRMSMVYVVLFVIICGVGVDDELYMTDGISCMVYGVCCVMYGNVWCTAHALCRIICCVRCTMTVDIWLMYAGWCMVYGV